MKINCFAGVLFSEDWWQCGGAFSKRHRGAGWCQGVTDTATPNQAHQP